MPWPTVCIVFAKGWGAKRWGVTRVISASQRLGDDGRPTSPCWWFCYSYICALSTVWEHILLTNFPNVLVSIVFISFFSCFQDVKSPFWGPQGSVAKLRRSTRITDRPSSTARRFTWRTIAAPGHQFSPNYGYLIGKIMINQGIFGYLIFKHSHIDMILVHWDATPS